VLLDIEVEHVRICPKPAPNALARSYHRAALGIQSDSRAATA